MPESFVILVLKTEQACLIPIIGGMLSVFGPVAKIYILF
jgi:hypothetical protein